MNGILQMASRTTFVGSWMYVDTCLFHWDHIPSCRNPDIFSSNQLIILIMANEAARVAITMTTTLSIHVRSNLREVNTHRWRGKLWYCHQATYYGNSFFSGCQMLYLFRGWRYRTLTLEATAGFKRACEEMLRNERWYDDILLIMIVIQLVDRSQPYTELSATHGLYKRSSYLNRWCVCLTWLLW